MKTGQKFPSSGFTLIELLLVISILALMASLILTAIDPVKNMKKARDAVRKSELSQIQTALESYFTFNGQYPPVGSDICGALNPDCLGWTDRIHGTCGGDQVIVPLVSGGWIQRVPEDPKAPAQYYYYKKVARDRYQLRALLENTDDKDATHNPPILYEAGCGNPDVPINYVLPK